MKNNNKLTNWTKSTGCNGRSAAINVNHINHNNMIKLKLKHLLNYFHFHYSRRHVRVRSIWHRLLLLFSLFVNSRKSFFFKSKMWWVNGSGYEMLIICVYLRFNFNLKCNKWNSCSRSIAYGQEIAVLKSRRSSEMLRVCQRNLCSNSICLQSAQVSECDLRLRKTTHCDG